MGTQDTGRVGRQWCEPTAGTLLHRQDSHHRAAQHHTPVKLRRSAGECSPPGDSKADVATGVTVPPPPPYKLNSWRCPMRCPLAALSSPRGCCCRCCCALPSAPPALASSCAFSLPASCWSPPGSGGAAPAASSPPSCTASGMPNAHPCVHLLAHHALLLCAPANLWRVGKEWWTGDMWAQHV